jgi:hypothetical protein
MPGASDYRHALGWLVAGGIIAFSVPAVFSIGLRWERSVFLIPYVAAVGLFLVVYFRSRPLSVRQWIGYWPYALVGTAAASFLLLRNIAGQPSSAMPEGGQLLLALAWVGLVYGVIDGLLLNVFPVLAVQGVSFFESHPAPQTRIARGALALAASLIITVIYHLGYTEFHGTAIVSVMIGNAIITSAYLFTGSPFAAVAAHVIMHTAAVLHGMETTLQLPPHYAG